MFGKAQTLTSIPLTHSATNSRCLTKPSMNCNISTIQTSSSRIRWFGRNRPMPRLHFELPKKEMLLFGPLSRSIFLAEPRILKMSLKHLANSSAH